MADPCPRCQAPLPDAVGGAGERVCASCGNRTGVPPGSATVTLHAGGATSVYLPADTPGTGTTTTPAVMGPKASLSHVGLEGGVTLAPPREGSRSGGTTTVATVGPATTGPSVGQVLGDRPGSEKYVVANEVARGGMGVILRAVDRDVRRDVAMKVLLRDDQPRLRERFVEEAQITGQLEHPNIVPVHELGVDADGRLFFTMKLVKGRSLAQVLSERRRTVVQAALQHQGAIDPEPTLRRLLQSFLSVANAVAFAHDRGVVHRDLKPANVMLGDFGEVLVMDWGLAKVRHGSQWTRRVVKAPATGESPRPAVGGAPTGRAADERLETILEAFRSHDGEDSAHAIEGTPAYMAPEQARGELDAIDERSDIYSLGAILYEILTLSPPVRGRSVKAILQDVSAGRVVPPSQRAPERQIPSELAAIAMKALARTKEERYQAVEELRRDVELYLEDRTVSAKDDNTLEVLVKLMRRNAEVAVAIAVASVVVVAVTAVSFRMIFLERERLKEAVQTTQASLAALRQEQVQRQLEQQRAAPALVAKARRAAERREFADAMQDVDQALAYDPTLPEARLLRAQLRLNAREFAEAAADLEGYLALRGEDADARRLADLVAQARSQPRNSAISSAIADVLVRQGASAIAESLFSAGRELIASYRERLERAWPGCTASGFEVDKDKRLLIDGLAGRPEVVDLAPLEGMPIGRLKLARTGVIDLAPLRGMPLTRLDLADTAVRSLEPLHGMAITHLWLTGTRVAELEPLKGMPLELLDCTGTDVADLAPLTGMPLASLGIEGTRATDLAPLAGMPLTELEAGDTAVADLAPLRGMRLTSLRLGGTRVADLSPLGRMPLTLLAIDGTRVADLASLKGMPLRTLQIARTQVADLAPLKGMALTSLDLTGLPVIDLAALRGMPLTTLVLAGTQVADLGVLQTFKLSHLSLADTRAADLRPLRGMALAALDLARTPVADLAPLAGMPLGSLVLDGTAVADLRPLIGLPLKELRLTGTRATDLAALAGLPLERLVLPALVERGLEGLRTIPTLRQLGPEWDGGWASVPAAEDFWRRFDAGEITLRPRP